MRLSGGDIDVTAGTGFRGPEPVALVRLTAKVAGAGPVVVWMRPQEARSLGLDLIGAAHAAINDSAVRIMAKQHGLDGDSLIEIQRKVTTDELGPG